MRRAKKRREKREKDDLIGSDQSGDQSEAESVDNNNQTNARYRVIIFC